MSTCSAFYYTIVVAVVGHTGVGKTALVQAYLKRHARKNRGSIAGGVAPQHSLPADEAHSEEASPHTGDAPQAGTPEDTHEPTIGVGVVPSAMQMEDLVHNRMFVYDTPGEEGRRSLGMGVVDGSVSTSHAAIVLYDVRDTPPYRTVEAAEWWLSQIESLGKDVKVCLVGAHADAPRSVPREMADDLAERFSAVHLDLSDVSTPSQAHRIFASVCEPVYLKFRIENSPLVAEVNTTLDTAVEEAPCAEEAGGLSPRSGARRKWQQLSCRRSDDKEVEEFALDLRYLPEPAYGHPPMAKQAALEGRPVDFVFRIYVCAAPGRGGVGCSSLLDAFASQMRMNESIGSNYATSLVTSSSEVGGRQELVQLKLHSPAVVPSEVYSGEVGSLLVCWCDRRSFDGAKMLLQDLPRQATEKSVLVRTKSDLAGCEVEQEEVDALRDALHIPCHDTSSKLWCGVNELFLSVTTAIRAKSQAYEWKAKHAFDASLGRLDKQCAQRRWQHLPLSSLTPLDCTHSALRDMFQELDVDRSGYIDSSELQGLRNQLDAFALNDFDRAVKSVQEQNGSTPGNRLSYDDFAGVLLRLTSL